MAGISLEINPITQHANCLMRIAFSIENDPSMSTENEIGKRRTKSSNGLGHMQQKMTTVLLLFYDITERLPSSRQQAKMFWGHFE